MNPDRIVAKRGLRSSAAGLGSVIGHVKRTRPLREYCPGLMRPGERKASSRWRRGRLQRGRRHSTNRCCILSPTRPEFGRGRAGQGAEMVLPAIEKAAQLKLDPGNRTKR